MPTCMLPWIHLATAPVPGDTGTLRLIRRGDEFAIMLGNNPLMNSRLSGSEEALARFGCGPIAGRSKPAVLIGGLGMGFTLRAALAQLPADASVTVAELVPAVVDWARGPMAEVFAGCLDDRRVRIHIGDVACVIRGGRSQYDAILLDVDNGPEGLTSRANDGLYDSAGLAAAGAVLRPAGVLAVWSTAPDPAFTARLKRAGFTVDEMKARAGRGRGARHVIWIATKPRPGTRGDRQ
jgi:spermidine synthase